MAKTSFIAACVWLLFISSACQISEGRQLRLREENDGKHVVMTSDQPLVPESPPQVSNAVQSPPPSGHVDNFKPTFPGHSPGAGHSLQLQNSGVHLVKDASSANDKNNSHSLAAKSTHEIVSSDEVVPDAPSPNANATNLPPPSPPTRRADDFKPTQPGHSPGAGHSIQN